MAGLRPNLPYLGCTRCGKNSYYEVAPGPTSVTMHALPSGDTFATWTCALCGDYMVRSLSVKERVALQDAGVTCFNAPLEITEPKTAATVDEGDCEDWLITLGCWSGSLLDTELGVDQ